MATIHRFTGTDRRYDWEDTRTIHYENKTTRGVTGKILLGNNEGAKYFVFRYFCVEPGGHSALNDFHPHDHGVIILHGQARVTVEDQEYELAPMDVIHISPWEHHSLAAIGNQPMGFLCVIANKDMLIKLQELEEAD